VSLPLDVALARDPVEVNANCRRTPWGVNIWISGAFAMAAALGCEAAIAGHEEQPHIHAAEYVASPTTSNLTPVVTGGMLHAGTTLVDLLQSGRPVS
jgi:hypothetical protein